MIDTLQYYIGERNDPHYNIAQEQYLLESVPPRCCTLYLWQNRHTVVIGRNQNAWQECRTTELSEDGGYLARRLSGGGAVFHDMGNLNFTFLVPTEEYDLDRQLAVIIEACRALGIPAERSGRNDLLTGERKFSGNAFYDNGKQAYHHGTLLIDVDMGMLSKYLVPSQAKLSKNGVASVRSRVVNLRELVPDLTTDEMAKQMVAAFEKVYGFTAKRLTLADMDTQAIDRLYQRNRSWEWNYGKKLAFTFACAARFSWGEVSVQLAVEGGVCHDAAVWSDAMEWAFAQELREGLVGCRFTLSDLQARVRALSCPAQIRDDLCEMFAEQNI